MVEMRGGFNVPSIGFGLLYYSMSCCGLQFLIARTSFPLIAGRSGYASDTLIRLFPPVAVLKENNTVLVV